MKKFSWTDASEEFPSALRSRSLRLTTNEISVCPSGLARVSCPFHRFLIVSIFSDIPSPASSFSGLLPASQHNSRPRNASVTVLIRHLPL